MPSNVAISALPSAAAIVGTEVLPVVQTGTTAKVTVANLAPGLAATLSGTQSAVVAANNVVGGTPVVHLITIANGASGDTDVTLTHKTRVLDAQVILTAAGDASNTYTIKNVGNAITNAITPSATDTTLARAGQINDANWDIAAGTVLRVSHVRIGGSSAALVVVHGVRVA